MQICRPLSLAVASSVGTLFLVSGCGGGESSRPVEYQTVNGRVADGYLRGATVYGDCNNNLTIDAGESQVLTGAGGTFQIKIPTSCPLVASVRATAIDEDTSTVVVTPYQLLSAPGSTAFISPLTTLVALAPNGNPGTSETDIRTKLGLLGDLKANYLTDPTGSGIRAHNMAKVVAKLLAENTLSTVSRSGQGALLLSNLQSVQGAVPSDRHLTTAQINQLVTFSSLGKPTATTDETGGQTKVRTTVALSSQQRTYLDALTSDPAIRLITSQEGIIRWDKLSSAKTQEVHSRLRDLGLIPDDSFIRGIKTIHDQSLMDVNAQLTLEQQKFSGLGGLYRYASGADASQMYAFSSKTISAGLGATLGALKIGLPAAQLSYANGLWKRASPSHIAKIKRSAEELEKLSGLYAVLATSGPQAVNTLNNLIKLSKGGSDLTSDQVIGSITLNMMGVADGLFAFFGKGNEYVSKTLKGISATPGTVKNEIKATLEFVSLFTDFLSPSLTGALEMTTSIMDAAEAGNDFDQALGTSFLTEFDKVFAHYQALINRIDSSYQQNVIAYTLTGIVVPVGYSDSFGIPGSGDQTGTTTTPGGTRNPTTPGGTPVNGSTGSSTSSAVAGAVSGTTGASQF